MFTVDSIIVKIWADAVIKGDKTIEQVPDLSNLIDIVTIIVEGVEVNV